MSPGIAWRLNYGAYQLGWLAAIVGAASGHGTAGALLAGTLTAGHVLLARDRRGELLPVVAALTAGPLVESWQLAAGTYRVLADATSTGLPPPWLLALWAQFATTFRFSRRRVMMRPWAAMLFGAVGGPVAFLAGERVGAVALAVPLGPALVRLVVAWALAWLAWLARRLAGATRRIGRGASAAADGQLGRGEPARSSALTWSTSICRVTGLCSSTVCGAWAMPASSSSA